MKKLILFTILSTFCLISNGQNKLGGYIMGANTALHNAANRQGDPIYKHTLTYSGGAGMYYTHFLSKKRSGNKRMGGRLVTTARNRWAVRGGIMFSSHNQKFKSEYKSGGEFFEHTGKKRLRLIKFGGYIEHSYPFFHAKKFNFIWFAGPQFSYMLSQKGGYVTWRHHDDGNDYYDLPPNPERGQPQYFKKLNLELAAAIGLEYHITRWVNLTFTMYADWSATTVENNDIETLHNTDPNWIDQETSGIYDRFDSRSNSHLSTHAILVGAEFTFHRAEHARAKF